MNNPASSRPSSFQHPLLNPDTLSTFFEHVSAEDLPSCRLVCKLWETASRTEWRSRATLVIYGECNRIGRPNESYRATKKKPDDRLTLHKFLSLSASSSGESERELRSKPFQRVALLEGNGGARAQATFFAKYGVHIKRLRLTRCEDWAGPAFKNLLLRRTPNLEVLTVEGTWPEKREFHHHHHDSSSVVAPPTKKGFPKHENLQIFHVNLFDTSREGYSLDFGFWLKHFPNIHTLKVRALDDVGHIMRGQPFSRMEDMLKGIAEVREECPNELNICHLDIMDALLGAMRNISPFVPLFQRANLPLKTLKIDLGFETEELAVQQLLQVHSSTLETLTCYKGQLSGGYNNFLGGGDDDDDDVQFPVLKEIVLSGAVAANFNFLRSTPNLRILKHYEEKMKTWPYRRIGMSQDLGHGFNIESTTEPSLGLGGGIRLEQMSKLRGEFNIESPTWFAKLGKWMPNLEKLQVPLNKETFPVVCSSWGSSLRHLTIPSGGADAHHDADAAPSQVDDLTITGLPRGWRKRARDEDDNNKDEQEREMKDRPGNITNLKVLERFEDRRVGSKCLSNHSIREGFLHLPHLQTIRVINVPSEEVNISSSNQFRLIENNVAIQFKKGKGSQ